MAGRNMKPLEKTLSSEGLSWIPEELMTVILLYIPVKSLMRFKMVSKSFNSLVSDSHFAKLHLRCSAPNANPSVLFWDPHDPDTDISALYVKSLLKPPLTITNELETISANWKKHPYMPIGSCNGLVCLIRNHEQFFWLSFWNPATRSEKSFTLPLTKPDDVWTGFGYDHVTDTYKVLFLEQNRDVLAFNMGDTNWRHIASFPPDLTTPEKGNLIGVHFNGTLNWLAVHKTYHLNIDGYNICHNRLSMVLSFDLNKEEFVRFSLAAMPSYFHDPHLGVLGECLYICLYDLEEDFMIWKMKEDGVDRSWTKLLKINLIEFAERLLPAGPCFPLYMFDNGDFLMLLKDYSPIRSYVPICINMRNNRLRRLRFPDEISLPYAMIFCESLISPC